MNSRERTDSLTKLGISTTLGDSGCIGVIRYAAVHGGHLPVLVQEDH